MKHQAAPKIVGHRGAHGHIPGNTQKSFERAIIHGVDEIETDCRTTKDGIVVQLHDAEYTDASGATYAVSDRTYAQLKADLPDVMTLGELIHFVDKRAKLMLEIKRGTDPAPVISIVDDYLKNGWQLSDFSFASFDMTILQRVRQHYATAELVVLEPWSSLRAVKRAKRLGTPYISMNQQYLWWGVVRNLAKHGFKLFTYPYPRTKLTFNHNKPKRWVKHGLYGIITDHPDLFE